MASRSRFGSFGLVGACLLLAAACSSTHGGSSGSADGGPGTGPGTEPGKDGGKTNTSGEGGTVSAKWSCCINDVFYACPNQAAFDKCAGGFDMGACMDACSPADPKCMSDCADQAANAKMDPSACAEKAGEKCPDVKPSASCNNVGTRDCDYDADCGSGKHCTSGKCYDNEVGSLCDYDADCGSAGHCTDGCCLTNQVGSKCDYDADCGSGNHCTNGECHENALGSPCDYDADCGSGNACTNGTCK